MSAILESVLDPERRASCKRWDALAEPAPATAFDLAVEQFLAKVDVSDVLDALADAEDALSAAIARNDVRAIGRIFLAVRRNYAESCVNHCDYAGALRLPGAGEVKRYVVHVTLPSPLIGMHRIELEAAGPEFARALAFRQVGVAGCTATVRPADPLTSYPASFVDSSYGPLSIPECLA